MNGSGRELAGRVLHPGAGRGEVLVLDAPLSFWGGTNADGDVIDVHHPQHGRNLAGRVLVMPSGRGSSSSSAVLAEQVRAGRAPAAILLTEPDTILVIGALAAAELYGLRLPIVRIDPGGLAGGAAGAADVRADPESMTATICLEDADDTI